MNGRKLGAMAAVAVCGAAIVFALAPDRPGEQSERTPARAGERPSIGSTPSEVAARLALNNAVTVAESKDERKVRDFVFAKVAEGFRAEGVEIGDAGKVVLTSQLTGGKLAAQLKSARAVHPGEQSERTRALERGKAPTSRTSDNADGSSVRYLGFFEGIDVEYRYDGKDIEELFHLSDDLKASLVERGEDLRITTLLPAVFRENGALLTAASQAEIDTKHLKKDESPPRPEEGHDRVRIRGDAELANGTHRFGLPAAVAIDSKRAKTSLMREFAWVPKGLEVTVEMPAAWLAEAQGKVVIDPSLVDFGRGINQTTWNERNFVKDSEGNFHVAYRGVYHGRWLPIHSEGDPGGNAWQQPDLIQISFGTSENQYYTPTLTIDSQDTLHAIWGDHGYVPNYSDLKGTHTSWGHRPRYARCVNGCAAAANASLSGPPVWDPPGEREQLAKLVPIVGGTPRPTDATHLSYYHMAVDSSDTLHIQFSEWGRISARHRYFQLPSGGEVQEKQSLGWNDIHAQMIVDENDQVHYLGSDYWGVYGVRHFQWDRTNEQWEQKANFSPRDPQGDNSGRMHGREMQAAVDRNNNIHVAINMYDRWNDQHYATWYGCWLEDPGDATETPPRLPGEGPGLWYGECPSSGNPAGTLPCDGSTSGSRQCGMQVWDPDPHSYRPSIVADDANNVWIAWRENRLPVSVVLFTANIFGIQMPPSGAPLDGERPVQFEPSAVKRLLAGTGTQFDPQFRPRLSYPRNGPGLTPGTNPNYSVANSTLDVMIVENAAELRYVSTGAPVEGAPPLVPLDGTFTKDSTPEFRWARIGADTGVGAITYWLELAPTAHFDSNVVRTNAGTADTYTWPTAMTNGQYGYWRVQAQNLNGLGPFGEIYEVGIDTDAPAAFSLTSPANGTDPANRTPVFEWETAADN